MSKQNRYCIHCGKELEEKAIFCPFCGKKVEDISEDISENISENMSEDMFEDDFEDPYAGKGSSSLLKWLVGVIVVLVVIIIAAIVLFLVVPKRDNGAASVEEPASESTGTAKEEEIIQDGNEPNDSEDQAAVLTDGSPVTGYLESKDDIDYFVIKAKETGSAVLEFRHTADSEKDGVGWRLSYEDNGRTSTELCWLSEEQTEIEISLASGDNYVYISADSAMSADTLERVRNTPYYISVTMTEEEEEEEEEEEQEPVVNSGYIIPDSSSRYLSASDLKGLSSSELRLARNEIYARHGRKFDDSGLQNYFNGQSWYKGTISPGSFSESILNAYEKANVELIRQYE